MGVPPKGRRPRQVRDQSETNYCISLARLIHPRPILCWPMAGFLESRRDSASRSDWSDQSLPQCRGPVTSLMWPPRLRLLRGSLLWRPFGFHLGSLWFPLVSSGLLLALLRDTSGEAFICACRSPLVLFVSVFWFC